MKLKKIKTLTRRLNITPSTEMYERTLRDTLEAQKNSTKLPYVGYKPSMWRVLAASRTGALIVGCLTIFLSTACFMLYKHTSELKSELAQSRREIAIAQKDVALTRPDDTTTINLYLKEHRDLVARHASMNSTASQSAQLRVNQHDILYYEFLDDQPEYMSPGIIVRGHTTRRQTEPSEAPIISNGHTITLSQARKITDFELRAPSRLFPGYALDQIRRIEDRDALQLLYTDGVNSISLFEQSLDGQRGLEAKDFREYAVYLQTEQAGGTILTWRDNELSYVLIGNIEMSQLMDMAQSISASK